VYTQSHWCISSLACLPSPLRSVSLPRSLCRTAPTWLSCYRTVRAWVISSPSLQRKSSSAGSTTTLSRLDTHGESTTSVETSRTQSATPCCSTRSHPLRREWTCPPWVYVLWSRYLPRPHMCKWGYIIGLCVCVICLLAVWQQICHLGGCLPLRVMKCNISELDRW